MRVAAVWGILFDMEKQRANSGVKAVTITSLQADISAKVKAAMAASQRSNSPRDRRVA